MRRIAVLVLVLVAACIDESLVPCGDLACPQGYECVATRCVTPAQLSACASLADGADCTVNHVAGKCDAGACTPVVCGNGVLDPGEICDDGNQVSGDGCNGTCTSNETCGNAVVDTAVGEGCDCGGSSNPSALCAHPNSADPSAECSLDCKPRFCGDGIVNTIEQCDGSVPASATCASFGYYRGDVTCQSCQLSPQDCSGRCGDAVIDADHGEYCDSALPADGSCLAFGYDNGVLTCGIGCGADLADCRQWGWERALPETSAVTSLDGNASFIAVAFDNGDAYARSQGAWVKAPDHYQLVTATLTHVWAVGSDALAVWDGTSWSSLMPAWPAATPLSAAWASDTLGLFVGHGNDATLDRYDGGVWTQVSDGGWGASPLMMRTHSMLWITDTYAFTAWSFDGMVWSAESRTGLVIEDDAGKLWSLDGSIPGANGLAAARGGIVTVDIESSSGGHHTEDLWFYGQRPMHITEVPGTTIAAGPDNTIYSAGDGLYELARGEWRVHDAGNLTLEALHGGELTYQDNAFGGNSYGGTTYAIELRNDDEFRLGGALPIGVSCQVAAATSAGTVLAGCTDGVYEAGAQVVPGVYADLLWAAADDSAAVAAGDSLFAWRTAGVWQSVATTLHFAALDGDALADLYAVDPAHGLFHFDGTAWSQLAADARLPFAITPTRVYFGTSQGAKVYMRASGVTTAASLRPGTTALAATGGEELFAIAPAQARGSPLWHYNGTSWAPLRLPQGFAQPIALLALGRELVVQQQQNTPAVPPFALLERTRAW
jgi:cysteine-rich repeat protein